MSTVDLSDLSDLSDLQVHLQAFFANPPTDASRVFHGRGHCFDDLHFITIDWFNPVVWVVIFSEQSEQLISDIHAVLKREAEKYDVIQCVAVQYRKRPHPVQEVIYGDLPQPLFAHENGLKLQINLADNQNIGFFLDAQPARQWVLEQAKGKNVLNLFAYTCAFSLAALQGEASQVVNIDMSKSAIATGQRNHHLNDIDHRGAVFLSHDIFRSIKKLSRYAPYDLVIIDPPSNQKGSFVVEKDYAKLLRKMSPLLSEHCDMLACLNAPYLDESFLKNMMLDLMPDFSFQQRLSNRFDFPEKNTSQSLKMLVFER